MKANELRGMTDAELVGTMSELKTEWRDLRFDAAIGKITNTTRIRKIKREIARIKTIQTEREMAAELERLLGE